MTHRKAHRRFKDRDREKSSSSAKSGGNAQLEAASQGNLSKLKSLLKSGSFGVHWQDSKGKDALMHAAIGGQAAAAAVLLESNADPTHVDNDGSHALIHAVKNNSKPVIELLLSAGRNNPAFQNVINIQDEKSRTALHYAVISGGQSIIQMLLKERSLNLYLPNQDSRGGIVGLSYILWDEVASPRDDKKGKKRPKPQDIRDITKMLVDEVHRRKELGKLWGLLLESIPQKAGEDKWPSDLFGALPLTALLQETGNTMNDPDVLYSLVSEVSLRISQDRYPPQLSPVDIDVLLDITLDIGDGAGYSTLKKAIGIIEAIVCPMENVTTESEESPQECSETLRGAPSSTCGAARSKKSTSISECKASAELSYLIVVWRHVHVSHIKLSNISTFLTPGSEGAAAFKLLDNLYSELATELGNKTRLGTRILQQESDSPDVWSENLKSLIDLHSKVKLFIDTYGHLSGIELGSLEPLPVDSTIQCLQPQMSSEHLIVVLIHIIELLERDGMYLLHNLQYVDNTMENFILLTALSLWLLTQLGRKSVLGHQRLQTRLESMDSIWKSFFYCVGYLDDSINSDPCVYDRFAVLLFCMYHWMQASLIYRRLEQQSNDDISSIEKLISEGGENMRIPVRVEVTQSSKNSDKKTSTSGHDLLNEDSLINSEGHVQTTIQKHTAPLLELTRSCLRSESLVVDVSAGGSCQVQQISYLYPKILNNCDSSNQGGGSFKAVAAWARCKPRREEQVTMSNPTTVQLFCHTVINDSDSSLHERAIGIDAKIKWLAGWNVLRGCHEVLSTRSRNTSIWNKLHPIPSHQTMEPITEEFRVSEVVKTIGGVLQLLSSLPVNPEFLHFCSTRTYEINHGILKGRLEGSETARGTHSLEIFIKHPQLLPLVAPVIAKDWIRTKADHMGRQQLHKLQEAYFPPSESIQPVYWVVEDKGGKHKKHVEKKELELRGKPICKWSLIELEHFSVVSSLQMGFIGIASDVRSDSSSDVDEDGSSAGWRTLHDEPKHDESLDLPPAATTTTQTSWPPDRLFKSVRHEIFGPMDNPRYPWPPQLPLSGPTSLLVYLVIVSELCSVEPNDMATHYKGEFIIGTPSPCGNWVQQRSSVVLYPIKTSDESLALRQVSPLSYFYPPSISDVVYFMYDGNPISYITNISNWDQFRRELEKALDIQLGSGKTFKISGRISKRTTCSPRETDRAEPTIVEANNEYTWPPISSLEHPLRITRIDTVEETDENDVKEQHQSDNSSQWTTGSNSDPSPLYPSRALGIPLHSDVSAPSSSYSDYIGMALMVDRNDFFPSIIDSVILKSVSDGIEVEFIKEPGSGDGPNKEFFGLLASELFHSTKHQLFVPAMDGENRRALIINKERGETSATLKQYFACGKLLAYAMVNCYEVGGVELVRGYYKILLSHPVVLSDLKNIDTVVHASLQWILENPVTDDMDLTFTHTVLVNGRHREINLIDNGENISVTNSNKDLYVKKKIHAMHTAGIEPFLQALASGFWSEAPSTLCRYVLCSDDIAACFAGISEISSEEWEFYTSYETPKLAQCDVIKWFWEYVRTLSQEDKRVLLTFATGSSTLPAGGFAGLAEYNGDFNTSGKAFTIDIITQQTDTNGQPMCDSKLQMLLPSAQTCFNTLLLPNYNSYERLKERLGIAMRMGHKGYDEE